jgi:hypothetical protein
VVKRYRSIEEALDPTRPLPPEPTTYEEGPTCGKFLYIIAKVQVGLPLSIDERTLVSETLRRQWLTRKEWEAYNTWHELQLYEAAKRVAHHGVPYKQREKWVQALYGKSPKALKQFIGRRRRALKQRREHP